MRRIAHLEALADRRFQHQQTRRTAFDKRLHDGCFAVLANICVIILYGTPRINEPLGEAWKRSLTALLSEFPGQGVGLRVKRADASRVFYAKLGPDRGIAPGLRLSSTTRRSHQGGADIQYLRACTPTTAVWFRISSWSAPQRADYHLWRRIADAFVWQTSMIWSTELCRLMASDDLFLGPGNLGNPTEMTVCELAEKVVDITGSRSATIFKPTACSCDNAANSRSGT